jgi:hypothetical protein
MGDRLGEECGIFHDGAMESRRIRIQPDDREELPFQVDDALTSDIVSMLAEESKQLLEWCLSSVRGARWCPSPWTYSPRSLALRSMQNSLPSGSASTTHPVPSG